MQPRKSFDWMGLFCVSIGFHCVGGGGGGGVVWGFFFGWGGLLFRLEHVVSS